MIKVPASGEEPEQIVKGLHKPIIDKDTFYKVQHQLKLRLRNKQKPNKYNEKLYLRGHLKCKKCGAILLMEQIPEVHISEAQVDCNQPECDGKAVYINNSGTVSPCSLLQNHCGCDCQGCLLQVGFVGAVDPRDIASRHNAYAIWIIA